jgi:hypothetical protein
VIRAASGLRDQVQAAAGSSTPATGASLALATLQSRLASLGSQNDDSHVDLSRDQIPHELRTTQPDQPSSTERIPSSTTIARPSTAPQLQLQLTADGLTRSDADPQAILASVNILITSAKAQQDSVRQAIDALSQQVTSTGATAEGSSLDATIAQLAGDLSTLQADYKQQTFQRDVLSQNVEQARSTRATLQAKLSETNVSADTGGAAIVASGADSVLPRSFPPSLSRSLPLTAVIALLIGAIVALLTDRRPTRPSASTQPVESAPPTPAAAAR